MSLALLASLTHLPTGSHPQNLADPPNMGLYSLPLLCGWSPPPPWHFECRHLFSKHPTKSFIVFSLFEFPAQQ